MNTIKTLILCSFMVIWGCQSPEKELTGFKMIIEAEWDLIGFDNPYWNRLVSKSEATEWIRTNQNNCMPEAYVRLGESNIYDNHEALEEHMDEIQSWLTSIGINKITFKLGYSDSFDSDILRIYQDGKIITPNQGMEPTSANAQSVVPED